ncbi:MAG: YceI family protein [Planctomycetota bacterium]|jgi:polyisoprenoid-binding protein YceI
MKKLILTLPLLVATVVVLAPRSESQAQATDYRIDPSHSSVIFKISHMGVSYTYGRFNKIDGALKFADGGDGSSIEVTVQTASVDTNDAKRDAHLKNADFFSAKEFPQITFKSKSWTKSGDGYDVTGDLTLHGVTKSVTLKVTKTGGEKKDPWGFIRIGFEGALSIKRGEFGMKKMLNMVGDDVSLMISIEAMRKA